MFGEQNRPAWYWSGAVALTLSLGLLGLTWLELSSEKRPASQDATKQAGDRQAADAHAENRQGSGESGMAPSHARALRPSSSTGSKQRQPAVDQRQRIREAIEQARVSDTGQLDAYLAMLVARARANGEVSALEVEPGVELIRRFDSDPEAPQRFAERMTALQDELLGSDRRAPPPPPQQIREQLGELLTDIESAAADTKQELILRYLTAADLLPEQEQHEAVNELDEMLGIRGKRASPGEVDALLDSIRDSEGQDARQALVQQYMQKLGQLDEPERDERELALEDLLASLGPANP